MGDDLGVQLLEMVGGNLFSDVESALDAPLMGWLTTFLGLGGGSDTDAQYQSLSNQLAQVVQGITSVQYSVNKNLENILGNGVVNAVSDATALTSPQGEGGWQPFSTLLSDLNTINHVMLGLSAGQTSYLAAFLQVNAPRFYNDATLGNLISYYSNVQAALTTMLVERAHLGDGWPTNPALWTPTPASPTYPSNYPSAAQCLTQCYNQIQQQKAQWPFSTAPFYSTSQDGLGADQIVVDKAPPGGQTAIPWAYQNWRNGGKYGLVSNAQPLNMVTAMNIISNANFWPWRVATLDELRSLAAANAAAATPFITAVTAGTTPAKGSGPFDIVLQYFDTYLPVPMTLPCAAQEAFGNTWHFNDSGSSCWCDQFYDLVANQQVTVTSNWWPFKDSTRPISFDMNGETGHPTVNSNDWVDIILVYQPTNTDPPLEEPSAMSIEVAPGWNPLKDRTTYPMRLMGTFQRMFPGNTSPSACQLDITQYAFWDLDAGDSSIATISNLPPNAGTITWLGTGTVTVTATRGALVATLTVSSPYNFQPGYNSAVAVNIYPLGYTNPTTSQMQVQFNMQILYKDGSVSTPATATGQPGPTNPGVNNQFAFSVSDPSVCFPVKGSPGAFCLVGSNQSGQVTITATHIESGLSVTATNTVPKQEDATQMKKAAT